MNVQWKRWFIVVLLVVAAAALMVQLATADVTVTGSIAVSATQPGTTEDGLDYEPEDVIVRETLYYDSSAAINTVSAANWYMLFEGDEHGLDNRHDIVAISIDASGEVYSNCGLDCVETLYLSFAQDAVPVPGIPLKVPGQDVVAFTPALVHSNGGTYETYFDGSDVGLTTNAEKIDGLDVWTQVGVSDVTFPEDCLAGILFISTQGNYRVPAANGGVLLGDGSDVLMFCATNLGDDTAGFWFRGFDNEDEGMAPPHALYGLDVNNFVTLGPGEEEEDEAADLGFYFIVKKSFTAPGVAGGPSELFYHDDDGTFSGPQLDFNGESPTLNGTAHGLDVMEMVTH